MDQSNQPPQTPQDSPTVGSDPGNTIPDPSASAAPSDPTVMAQAPNLSSSVQWQPPTDTVNSWPISDMPSVPSAADPTAQTFNPPPTTIPDQTVDTYGATPPAAPTETPPQAELPAATPTPAWQSMETSSVAPNTQTPLEHSVPSFDPPSPPTSPAPAPDLQSGWPNQTFQQPEPTLAAPASPLASPFDAPVTPDQSQLQPAQPANASVFGSAPTTSSWYSPAVNTTTPTSVDPSSPMANTPPTDASPTDLSQLAAALNPSDNPNAGPSIEAPQPQVDPATQAPAANMQSQPSAVVAPSGGAGKSKMFMIAGAALLLVVVLGLSAYFILGIGGSAEPEIAETTEPVSQQPLTNPPQVLIPTQEPLITQQPLPGDNGLGSLPSSQSSPSGQVATPTPATAGPSALDLLRQRQGQ